MKRDFRGWVSFQTEKYLCAESLNLLSQMIDFEISEFSLTVHLLSAHFNSSIEW